MTKKALLRIYQSKLWFFALAALFLWALFLHPNGAPMPGSFQVTDFLVTHLSIAQHVHDGLFHYGQIPLWNVFQFSGQPMAADPLTGYGYLPNWLTYLLPIPFAFNFLCWIHLAWSGLGLYTFLQKEKLHPAAALIASIAWMGTPKIIAHLGAGHISTFFAIAWIPWLLVTIHELSLVLSIRNSALAGSVLAIVFLADIRWGVYAAFLSGAYFLSRIDFTTTKFQRLVSSLVIWMLAFLVLTASISLPLIEFMGQSRRSSLTLVDLGLFAIQPGMLIGLFAPQLKINYEQITYLGIIPLLLAGFGIRKKTIFWVITAVFCIFFSFGSNSFLFPLISAAFQGMNWLRVPSRLWFFVSLSICILSAYGLDRILKNGLAKKSQKVFNLTALAVSASAILLAVGMSILSGSASLEMITMAVVIPASFLSFLWLTRLPNAGMKTLLPLLMVLICDLLWVNRFSLTSFPVPEPTPVVQWLNEQNDKLFRVFSPSYSFPMPNLLQQANGVNPLHLSSYAQFIGRASHIATGDYSVSLPDIYIDENTPEAIRLAAQAPDTVLLGELNVLYLAADFPLTSPGLKLTFHEGDQYVYENLNFRERAWMEEGKVEITRWSPNAITVQTRGAGGQLVLSEIDYPGWVVRIDQQPVPIQKYQGLLRSATVEPGDHTVDFVFRPVLVYVGSAISLLGWIAVVFVIPRTSGRASAR